MQYRIQLPTKRDFIIGYHETYIPAMKAACELSMYLPNVRVCVYRESSVTGIWVEECSWINGQ